MSRSLGDLLVHSVGVSSEPEFTEKKLDESKDKFIVIATDGLWEFLGSDETVEIITGATSPKDSVDILVKEATERWMEEEQLTDDTTIIVAYLFDYK